MIPFTKAHGNGNDFVLFDAAQCPEIIRTPMFIQAVCDRHKGVGADGVLVLSEPTEAGVNFNLDYYNSDGSWATLCGNGSRCAVALYYQTSGATGRIVFLAGDGSHWAELSTDGIVTMQFKTPNHVTPFVEPCGYLGRHVDSGARHYTTEVAELSWKLVAKAGPGIRYHELFEPEGVNVNFFKGIDKHTIEVITYEKGVEANTLSCASGSVAAAFQAASTGDFASPLKVISPGGQLVVTFDEHWENVALSGPVVLVFSSSLPDNFGVSSD